MRLSNRDWIAWSMLMAIVIITGAYFYTDYRAHMTYEQGVYRIVVTPDSK